MNGLTIKDFGNPSATTKAYDFSGLEENAKFKASQEGGENAEAEAAKLAAEVEAKAAEEAAKALELENQSKEKLNEEGKPSELQNKGGEEKPSDSSLKPNEIPERKDEKPLEVTEEMLFKALSERLGKEVKSIDDLKPADPFESDPQLKEIRDWREKTNRPYEDFFKYQKDYSKVVDLEVAREYLQIEYPSLTADEIGLELEKFIVSEDDLDREVALKKLELKKYATKGRTVLEGFKSKLTEPAQANFSPEIKKQLEFASSVQKSIESNKITQAEYEAKINSTALSTDKLKLKLSDDLSIDFSVSEENRKKLTKTIAEMPHWRHEDGSWNHKAVVEDAIKISHFDDLVKIAFEQGVNFGKDETIKTAKNSTLGESTSKESTQGIAKKGIIIEDIDKILGKRGLSFK